MSALPSASERVRACVLRVVVGGSAVACAGGDRAWCGTEVLPLYARTGGHAERRQLKMNQRHCAAVVYIEGSAA